MDKAKFVEYWKNQFILSYFEENYCKKCVNKLLCWEIEGCVYNLNNMLSLCKHRKLREAISKLRVLKAQPWDLGNVKQRKLVEIAEKLANEELGRVVR